MGTDPAAYPDLAYRPSAEGYSRASQYNTAFQKHIHCALGDHQKSSLQFMDGGHHLSVRIEGNLCQPGPAVSDNVLIKAVGLSEPYQRRFRRIADLVVTADGGIAAQQGRPQQRLL